ncbi:hypothetical protein [Mesorhizobium sp. GbtcB19]|uniref:hypothetical protein n=1 Tax=Mesorhizobium sp. GbtcB19 TaxID=2824764 RepID=UPI001C2F8AD5|nr:hypothetical protein [Mesorhizobium sp. GbtcB19]
MSNLLNEARAAGVDEPRIQGWERSLSRHDLCGCKISLVAAALVLLCGTVILWARGPSIMAVVLWASILVAASAVAKVFGQRMAERQLTAQIRRARLQLLHGYR